MPFFFTGNDLDGILLTAPGDTWINAASTFVANELDAFNFAATTFNTLLVQGTIVSAGSDAIVSDVGSNSLSIRVAETGSVLGASDGIELEGANHTIVNKGVIEGLGDAGIQMFLGEAVDIINYGDVLGQRAVAIDGGSNHLVRNFGSIVATNELSPAVDFNDASGKLFNTGVISGVNGVSFSADADLVSVLKNNGLITATGDGGLAVSGGAGNERVANKGVMEGDILLGAGNDVYKGAKGELEGFIKGGSGDDSITTGLDDDSLYGDAGNDTLSGGAGLDIFFFNTTLNASNNVDTLVDFNIATDRIRLENAVFTEIVGTGTLSSGQFAANATGVATQADDRIIYETDTGRLFYDSNGSGAGGSTLFAILTNRPALSAQDFFVG